MCLAFGGVGTKTLRRFCCLDGKTPTGGSGTSHPQGQVPLRRKQTVKNGGGNHTMKKALIYGLSLAMLLSLTACHKPQDNQQDTSQPDPAASTSAQADPVMEPDPEPPATPAPETPKPTTTQEPVADTTPEDPAETEDPQPQEEAPAPETTTKPAAQQQTQTSKPSGSTQQSQGQSTKPQGGGQQQTQQQQQPQGDQQTVNSTSALADAIRASREGTGLVTSDLGRDHSQEAIESIA